MNDYLKVSVGRYPKNLESVLIHPISTIDAEIIVEIMEILKKVDRSDVKVLLDKYKYLKDEKIRDLLLQWNIAHPIGTDLATSDETGQNQPISVVGIDYTRDFIYIKNFRIELTFIHSYETKDEYNFVRNMMEYFIILNALPETTDVRNTTSNKKIIYDDMEERDQDFEILDTYMTDSDKIRFINERPE
jgi:hypothetical protein